MVDLRGRRFDAEMDELCRGFVSLRTAIKRSHLHGDPHGQEVLERMRQAIRDLADLLGMGDVVDLADAKERNRRGGP